MFTILGLLGVFGAVLGGFAMAGGPVPRPRSARRVRHHRRRGGRHLLAAAPGAMRGRLFRVITKAFAGTLPAKQDYLDLPEAPVRGLQLHAQERRGRTRRARQRRPQELDLLEVSLLPEEPPRGRVLRDALKQIVNGTASAEELDVLLDTELETHHEEGAIPVALLQKVADSLPGLGIVAAVLGIVITMGHLDGGPRRSATTSAPRWSEPSSAFSSATGSSIRSRSNAELQDVANGKYLRCIKEGVVASLRGSAPIVASSSPGRRSSPTSGPRRRDRRGLQGREGAAQ
jgi:chemotaxis protein MotA